MFNREKRQFEQYQDMIVRLFPEYAESPIDGKTMLSRTVTFQVTDACNLACKYCYQINKGKRHMSFETAKKFIDLLLSGDKGFNEYLNPDISPALIVEFIGGEPFLEIDLIDQVVDYLFKEMIRLRHPWAEKWMISICSNGVLYSDPKVQKFLSKWKNNISFSITIDGNKELHDSCRVFPDGSPSYDIAIAGARDWMSRGYYMGSKITISPFNLKYTYDAIVDIINQGYLDINANCVYEEGWEQHHAVEFYYQLKRVADYIFENNLEKDLSLSLFVDTFFKPKASDDVTNWCGGTGLMLSCDPDGYLYPCIRYMESSLGTDRPPFRIGDVDNGIAQCKEHCDRVSCLNCINRRSESTDECFYCPIAEGCSWCFPAGTKINTPNGLRNIEDLKIGDLVIDMNGDIQKVENNLSRTVTKDNLVTVSAAGFSSIVTTSEHPFWCKPVVKRHHNIPVYGEPQWVEAKNLKTSDKIGLFVPKPGKKEVNENFAYVIGRYVGDGWKTDSNRAEHPFRYYICTAFEEQEEFESYLNNSGITYRKNANRTVEEYHLHISENEYLVKLLDDCGRYAKDKRVPREVWNWDEKSIAAFLKGYFDADGCIDKKHNSQRYTSISKELILNIAELVRMIYHKNVSIATIVPNSTTVIEGRTVNQQISYEGKFKLNVPQRKYYEFDEKNNIMWVNVNNNSIELPETETVYNLTIENTHSYIANGAIVHNCSGYNYQVNGTPDSRVTYICEMHKARALANAYFWSRYYEKHSPEKTYSLYIPKVWWEKIIPQEEYDMIMDNPNIIDENTDGYLMVDYDPKQETVSKHE